MYHLRIYEKVWKFNVPSFVHSSTRKRRPSPWKLFNHSLKFLYLKDDIYWSSQQENNATYKGYILQEESVKFIK